MPKRRNPAQREQCKSNFHFSVAPSQLSMQPIFKILRLISNRSNHKPQGTGSSFGEITNCKLLTELCALTSLVKRYRILLTASPQGQGCHNSVRQLLCARITYPTLSTFPVGGNRSTRRKPTTFGRALTMLFSH